MVQHIIINPLSYIYPLSDISTYLSMQEIPFIINCIIGNMLMKFFHTKKIFHFHLHNIILESFKVTILLMLHSIFQQTTNPKLMDSGTRLIEFGSESNTIHYYQNNIEAPWTQPIN